MRDGVKEYEICKEACINEGCYCPEDYKFHSEVANTPMFIRTYFFQKGWEEHNKECDAEQPKNEFMCVCGDEKHLHSHNGACLVKDCSCKRFQPKTDIGISKIDVKLGEGERQ